MSSRRVRRYKKAPNNSTISWGKYRGRFILGFFFGMFFLTKIACHKDTDPEPIIQDDPAAKKEIVLDEAAVSDTTGVKTVEVKVDALEVGLNQRGFTIQRNEDGSYKLNRTGRIEVKYKDGTDWTSNYCGEVKKVVPYTPPGDKKDKKTVVVNDTIRNTVRIDSVIIRKTYLDETPEKKNEPEPTLTMEQWMKLNKIPEPVQFQIVQECWAQPKIPWWQIMGQILSNNHIFIAVNKHTCSGPSWYGGGWGSGRTDIPGTTGYPNIPNKRTGIGGPTH